MAQVKFYGYSDDLVEIEADAPMDINGREGVKNEEFNIFVDEVRDGIILRVSTPEYEDALVYARYENNGCWSFALGLFDEGTGLPQSWNPRITFDEDVCNYSAILLLDLPEGSLINVHKER